MKNQIKFSKPVYFGVGWGVVSMVGLQDCNKFVTKMK